ncbi:cell division ATP-binding protein FtsE [candidate division CSSED10-310 bacterium]|uniref:Cell division ATP-binding protein FtsE n=1 Tax=candidate division CSSED10-310 bacterium TaxID=2855610 RepID=A0ABV6YQY2_UNCC1
MIQLYHVEKRYAPNIIALNDINLHIKKGEFIFLTGHTGAGKSTLLRVLLREELPTKGQIIVHGRNIVKMRNTQIPYLRREIGIVFQDFKLMKERTVFENVALALRILNLPKSEINKRVWQTLRMVDLSDRSDTPVIRLSGGEQQRVAIARAVINEPVILLADEPTGSLDPTISEYIMSLFEDINARGTTVLIATHDIDTVQRMKKRWLSLQKGKISEQN